MIEGRHYQNAYVTRDVDAAMARFRETADVRQEASFRGGVEVTQPQGRGMMENKLGFMWVGDLQYEFIEPLSGLVGLYAEALPEDDSLVFHHICMRVDDWDDFRKRVDQQPLPIVLEGESGPLKFLYLDARPTLGHYLEYTSMPDAMWEATGGR